MPKNKKDKTAKPKKNESRAARILQNKKDYAYAMVEAPSIDQSSSWLHMIPIAFFGAIVIMTVMIHTYKMPMTQFFWTDDTNETDLCDFFSYGKMVFIVISACIALLMLLYRVTTQSLTVKKSFAYLPMLCYCVLTVLSYAFSEYKDFALLGWNDRFEGTIPIVCYMIVLFLIINSVNTEQNVKQVLWPIGIGTTILSLIGISQAMDRDFFRTRLGQKILCFDVRNFAQVSKAIDEKMDAGQLYLTFTFNNKEIYQTVYNINYVSFYLTLLVPIFVMLFIRAMLPETKEKNWKKILIGVYLGLLVFNLIGSASAGGFLGLGFAVILAIILFNKQLKKWLKPLLLIIIIVAIVAGFTYNRWLPEISNAVKGVLNIEDQPAEPAEPAPSKEDTPVAPGSKNSVIDYMETKDRYAEFSLNGNILHLEYESQGKYISSIVATDGNGEVLSLYADETGYTYYFEDERYRDYAKLIIGYDSESDLSFSQLVTGDVAWTIILDENGETTLYLLPTKKTTKVGKVEHFGFENNQYFGSGRGYIWSRSLPLLKHTLILGKGADTYCAYFPQNDYAGKYNAYGAQNIYLIVDKPHNMYIHMGVGTGCLSLIIMLCFFAIYLIQSLKLFWKRDFGTDFLNYAGVGAFLGVFAFLVTGLVDDSTVSVMPLFYTTLGLGLAINMIIQRRDGRESSWKPWDKKVKKTPAAAE